MLKFRNSWQSKIKVAVPLSYYQSGRDKLNQVNAIIAKLDNGKNIHFLDIGSKFLQPDGSLSKDDMPDFLHLSDAGYQIWADAIGLKLAELMK